MPWASITRPGLALCQFSAQLAEAGLPARVHNVNLAFARAVGFDRYESIGRFKGVHTQVGEWLFAHAAWGHRGDSDAFLRQAAAELGPLPRTADLATFLLRVRDEVVDAFLDDCVRRVGDAPVVGFSCTFFQTVPALALGRRLKARNPDVRLVFGGACFHGEMGEELFARVPWIDAVATGEADDVVVPLFQALLRGDPPRDLPGVTWRAGGETGRRAPAPVEPATLDALPDPEFADFFAEAERVGLTDDPGWRQRVVLPIEGSRGCWWGEKQHCTFCGLNAEGLAFRARSPDRLLRQIAALQARWSVGSFFATDNILANRWYKDLLPRLDPTLTYFWEIKANVAPWQVEALAKAGVRYVQPGIESLATSLLDRTRKGVTGLQNVHLLKLCRAWGVVPFWNQFLRVPGEDADAYRRIEAWIPRLLHLTPPSGGAIEVECHRFSPYHFDWQRWSTAIRPRGWYRHVYPEGFDLDRLAYYFDADWKDVLDRREYVRTRELCDAWLRSWQDPPFAPRLVWLEEGRRVEDTRGPEGRVWLLEDDEARVLQAIEAPASVTAVARGTGLSEGRVAEVLATLDEAGLVVEEGGRWLGLPIDAAQCWEPPLELRRRLFRA